MIVAVLLGLLSVQANVVSVLSRSAAVSTIDPCEEMLTNTNWGWIALNGLQATSGIAEYYDNGTINAWDASGKLSFVGRWQVKVDPTGSWCYAAEEYEIPAGVNLCNTFTLSKSDDVVTSFVGCQVIGGPCVASCNTEDEWKSWYVARLRHKLPAIA